MTQEAAVRCFIAWELPDTWKTALIRVAQPLRPWADRLVRWVRPDGIHLTFAFLGQVPPANLQLVRDALDRAGGTAPSLTAALGPVGSFGDGDRLRVLWASVEADPELLSAVHEAVWSQLVSLGFEAERRPFAPHLTLARVRDEASAAERVELFRRWRALQAPRAPAASLTRLTLFQSDLGPGGARYTPLHQVTLNGG